jgi:hypothetical protein
MSESIIIGLAEDRILHILRFCDETQFETGLMMKSNVRSD